SYKRERYWLYAWKGGLGEHWAVTQLNVIGGCWLGTGSEALKNTGVRDLICVTGDQAEKIGGGDSPLGAAANEVKAITGWISDTGKIAPIQHADDVDVTCRHSKAGAQDRADAVGLRPRIRYCTGKVFRKDNCVGLCASGTETQCHQSSAGASD